MIEKVDGIVAYMYMYMKDTVKVQNWQVEDSLVVLIVLRF